MELSVLVLQAVNIALWAIDKASGGALEKAGADVLGFLANRWLCCIITPYFAQKPYYAGFSQ
jgi:hypothetical protein